MSNVLLKNVRLIDGSIVSILIENQKIKKIAPSIDYCKDVKVIELDDDSYVSAGWIDAHTHCFEKFELYADNCEEIGYKKGVTTVVDAGTAGADNIDEFYQSIQGCKTHVYSLLNIAKTGIYAQNELADMQHIDKDAFMNACEKYPHFIVGVKARMSKSVVGDSLDQPLFKALEIAEETKLPLMVHVGTAPSKLDVVMKNMRKNDIITHVFNPKENGIIENGKIKPFVLETFQRGVYFDLGHGTDSFSFDVLNIANQNHLKIYTISSDIYHRNRKNGPVYDLATTMTKLYMCGYSLQEVIDAVTIHPSQMLNLKNIGEIKEGFQADFTFFKVVHGDKELIDSTGKKKIAHSYIQPIAVFINDEYICLKEKENG